MCWFKFRDETDEECTERAFEEMKRELGRKPMFAEILGAPTDILRGMHEPRWDRLATVIEQARAGAKHAMIEDAAKRKIALAVYNTGGQILFFGTLEREPDSVLTKYDNRRVVQHGDVEGFYKGWPLYVIVVEETKEDRMRRRAEDLYNIVHKATPSFHQGYGQIDGQRNRNIISEIDTGYPIADRIRDLGDAISTHDYWKSVFAPEPTDKNGNTLTDVFAKAGIQESRDRLEESFARGMATKEMTEELKNTENVGAGKPANRSVTAIESELRSAKLEYEDNAKRCHRLESHMGELEKELREAKAREVVFPARIDRIGCDLSFAEIPLGYGDARPAIQRAEAYSYCTAVARRILDNTPKGVERLYGIIYDASIAAWCGSRSNYALFRFPTMDNCELFIRSVGTDRLNLVYGL